MDAAASTIDLARQALQESPIPVLRGLTVEQDGPVLIIQGRVSSFYQKQMAQEAIRAVCANVDLQNIVDVDK